MRVKGLKHQLGSNWVGPKTPKLTMPKNPLLSSLYSQWFIKVGARCYKQRTRILSDYSVVLIRGSKKQFKDNTFYETKLDARRHYGKGVIYYGPIFRLTKSALCRNASLAFSFVSFYTSSDVLLQYFFNWRSSEKSQSALFTRCVDLCIETVFSNKCNVITKVLIWFCFGKSCQI